MADEVLYPRFHGGRSLVREYVRLASNCILIDVSTMYRPIHFLKTYPKSAQCVMANVAMSLHACVPVDWIRRLINSP